MVPSDVVRVDNVPGTTPGSHFEVVRCSVQCFHVKPFSQLAHSFLLSCGAMLGTWCARKREYPKIRIEPLSLPWLPIPKSRTILSTRNFLAEGNGRRTSVALKTLFMSQD